MKLKYVFIFSILVLANPSFASDDGVRLIATRGKILCGTDLDAKTYAYRDEEDETQWKGIDVDLCKTFANAILGRSDLFEMVNVNANEIKQAFATNKIDVMLGGAPYSASMDADKKYKAAGITYYDKQLFLTKNVKGATSMEAYKGKRVCAVGSSEDFDNVQDFSKKYDLDLKPLMFVSNIRAKEAFFLKRCDIMTGNEIYLKGLIKNNFTDSNNLTLIPETIKIKPMYAFVSAENESLAMIVKWILNALVLTEEKGISSKNVETFIGEQNTTVKNLLGIDGALWKKFRIEPTWVKMNTLELGNFGEIYERNLGMDSELKIPREDNKLLMDGGLFKAQPFI